MRVLFVPMAWYSHYFCMLPLAWGFRAEGHEVTVAAQPTMADTVRESGMIGVTVGRDYDFIGWNRRRAGDVRVLLRDKFGLRYGDTVPAAAWPVVQELMFESHSEMTEAIVGDLVEFARRWRPDLIVADPFVYAATVAAEVVGAPLARHLLGPDYFRHVGSFPGMGMAGDMDPDMLWPDGLRRTYQRYGVRLKDDFATWTVDPCPASMQIPGVPNRLPVRYVPYNGPGTVPSWALNADGPVRVCVSWGKGMEKFTGTNTFPLSEIAAAMADLDAEAVLAVLRRDDGEIADQLPANVRVVEGYPLHVLLPRCDAIINQGGAGTVLTAAAYGVPQVIVPQVTDQPFVAERLASTGAGIAVARADADIITLKSAAAAVLESAEIRRAAAGLAEEIAGQPSPADVARTLADSLA